MAIRPRQSLFWDSVAAAVGLFHNLGSFAPSVLSTHTSQTGSSEFPTFIYTRQFGPSGGRVSSLTWYCKNNDSITQCYGVRGWSRKLDIFLHMGKCISPTPVAQKHRHGSYPFGGKPPKAREPLLWTHRPTNNQQQLTAEELKYSCNRAWQR